MAFNSSDSRAKIGGASVGDLATIVIDPVGQVEAHSPQPMHFSRLMTVASFPSAVMACTLQRSMQVKQSLQVSSSFTA